MLARGIVTDRTIAGSLKGTTIVGFRSSDVNETPRVDVTWNSMFSPFGKSLGVVVIILLTPSSTACISSQGFVVVPVARVPVVTPDEGVLPVVTPDEDVLPVVTPDEGVLPVVTPDEGVLPLVMLDAGMLPVWPVVALEAGETRVLPTRSRKILSRWIQNGSNESYLWLV